MAYADLAHEELLALKAELEEAYGELKARNLKLNMARGKPGGEQLKLSLPMLDCVTSDGNLIASDGTDCCNYGVLDGIPEAKTFMAEMMDHDPANVCVFGNSSLNIMYDLVAGGVLYGYSGEPAWKDQGTIKWLCPSPGYDRHFRICETLGMELIPIELKADGPDMDKVEELVADPAVKGIWCVPQYSNPTGTTYSDEVVKRLASMPVAAKDFRIFWDNAYCVHDLYDETERRERVLDIARTCVAAGNPDRYFKFASTSKVTLPGAGIAAVAASADNIAVIRKRIGTETVGYDKLNQLRHVKFLKDRAGLDEHMKKHAAIIRPKFELVVKTLAAELGDTGATWSTPNGGYFISFDGAPNTAQRTVQLAKEAGVVMTGAGATWPYGKDPLDRNIRIAPTLPPLEELEQALEVFCCSAKLATVESLLA
ncbi:aminotransferase class I/II-fold pyridoxal phosphate-dependent enzyme [Slackia heliotrinireducens]|uniref:aminotransferase class I/II-fold pyridoxal phosphate-dependent enzyme n=1 Tax=Slackia heliotrinireducens TaxID=84110 RepID=UPI003315AFCD